MRRVNRRAALRAAALGAVCTTLNSTSLCSRAWAAKGLDPEKSGAEMITPATSAAIERGLAYLAAHQDEDGTFTSGRDSRNVAVAGLAGMAFMSAGSTPGRGPNGVNVDRCIDYILSNMQESGFITVPSASSHGPMYGHGFATLFLAECYGMR